MLTPPRPHYAENNHDSHTYSLTTITRGLVTLSPPPLCYHVDSLAAPKQELKRDTANEQKTLTTVQRKRTTRQVHPKTSLYMYPATPQVLNEMSMYGSKLYIAKHR